ncbi:MAG TPA: hypothetical protein DCS43_08535 [Verrucomicrobia bacterium]|nr:hypothetical protein [Verrucomicrobiota bacterium]
MTDRRDMAQTMMIDFHPARVEEKPEKPEPLPPSPPPPRAAGQRFVVRRPGMLSSKAAPLKLPQHPVALSNDLINFFEGIYDAALLTDMQGNIIDANVRAVQFFGFTRDHFKRSVIGDIIAGIGGAILETINNNLRNNQFTLLQTDCRRNDGTRFPAEISTSLIALSKKQLLCFFVRDVSVRRTAEEALQKAHDALTLQVEERTRANQELVQEIAERQRIENELTAAIAQLQQHDEAKSEFISNVSHEFRTPLTSIKYFTDNMIRGIVGDISRKGKEYLSMILADCDRLARTVEDILDLSRIDADSLRMNWVRAPIGRLVKRTVDSLRVQAEKEGLRITCTMDEEALFATCDVQKFERVILNIVKNAIKFTPGGGHIEVHVHPASTPYESIWITVCDTGPGIPPEHIGRVTERYYRVGEYVSGTGLGLAICKELMAFHNGILDLQSPVPGTAGGTQVTVVLPRVSPPHVYLLNATPPAAQALYKEVASQGYPLHVSEAVSGFGDVLPSVEKPAVIMLDWTGPGMNAGIMLAHMQGHPDYSALPRLVLTGESLDATRDEILQGLGVAVLQAPWSPGHVLNMLEGMIPDPPVGKP